MRSKLMIAVFQVFLILALVMSCAPVEPVEVEEPDPVEVEEPEPTDEPEPVEEPEPTEEPEPVDEPAPGEPQYGGRAVLTTGDSPSGPAGSLDGGSTHDTRLNQLYMDSLMLVRQDGELDPRLAESMEQSDDGLVWTITLHPDALWHDGEPIVADDLIFTIETICAGETDPPSPVYEFPSIVGYQAFRDGEADSMPGLRKIDDKTIEIETTEPNAQLRYQLAQFITVPAHVWQDVAPGRLLQHPGWLEQPVGSGPFKHIFYEADQRIEFEAFEDYYRGRPYLDEVIVRIGPYDTTLAALEAGEVDLVTYIDVLDAERLEPNPNITVGTTQLNRSWGMMFHFYQEDLQDVRVRQALTMAIDRDAYNNAILGGLGNTKVKNWFTPGTWQADPDLPADEYNPERARELLEEAGFDFDNTVMGIGIMPANVARARIGEFFQANLREIGVQSEIIPIEESIIVTEWWHRRDELWFTILFIGGTHAVSPYGWWPMFRTDSDRNLGLYQAAFVDADARGGLTSYEAIGYLFGDDELDALLAKALDDPTPANLHEVDRYLHEQVPAIQVVGPPISQAWNTNLQGRPSPDEFNIETWYKPEQWWMGQ